MEKRSKFEHVWAKSPNIMDDTKKVESKLPSATATPGPNISKPKTDKPPIAFPIAFPFLRNDPLATGVPASPFRKTPPKPLPIMTGSTPKRIGIIPPAVPLIPFSSNPLGRNKTTDIISNSSSSSSSSSKVKPKSIIPARRIVVATPLLTKVKPLNPESPLFEAGKGTHDFPTGTGSSVKSKSTSNSSDISPFSSFTSRLKISDDNKVNAEIGYEGNDDHSDHEIPETPTPETSFGDSTMLFGTETTKVTVYIITGDITGRGPTEAKILHREAYTSICIHPLTVDERELWSFLSTVMHDEGLWLPKRWSCNLCTKTALRCKTYANPYLEFEEPLVLVFQLPVCKNELCANAAEALYVEMMTRMNGSPPFLREGKCITCGRDCSTRVISGGSSSAAGTATTTTTTTTETRSKYKMCQGCTRDCQKKVWPEYNNARQRERRISQGLGGDIIREENEKDSEGAAAAASMGGDRPRFTRGGPNGNSNRSGGSNGRMPGSRRSGGRGRRHERSQPSLWSRPTDP